MKKEQTLPTEKITKNSEQLAVLKDNFPNCFDKQGKFIVSKLQEILQADGVDLSRESYSLNWLGKSYARVLANEPIRTMLSEDTEHNQLEQNKNSHNLLIQGDNLEVLKHLKGAYTDKIKMIYIDPPYNTGSDGFIYQDDRSFSPEQFAELAGVDLDEAQRVLDFTQSNANSHSAWLTFIYPRLYIAKQLLKDDGVIFISIDENEHSQLKILCDEIYGEQNFITDFVWKNKKGGGNDSIHVAIEHEYIIMYARDKNKLDRLFETYKPEYLLRYNQEDEESKFYWDTFKRKSGKQYYPIVCPDGIVLEYDENGNKISWLRSQNRFKSDLKKGDVRLVQKEGGSWSVQFKQRLPKGKKPRSIFIEDNVLENSGTTSNGSDDLFNLFNFHPFSNPKPIKLISNLLQIVVSEDDIILDFFAGSGSTAHSILNENIDGANRRFICVQIAEQIEQSKEAYKAGYRTIFEITKDRIIKAGEKLAQEYTESHFDRGFKIFKTCDNFLPSSSYRNLKQLTLEQTNTSVVTTGFDEAQLQDILTTWKGLDKILLSENLHSVSLGNYLAYGLGHVLYLVNKGFNTEALKVLIQKLDDEHEFQVSKLVILGHHFDSKSQREIDEAMKNYSNKKSIPVDVVVRY
ncbi:MULTISPECIES: site-specific DNA-methyltransferase [Acinetobacter]|uniref:site-specific DNA-methyltransferase (adenine-specific) n=2 Tax=Acinetobacter TaxID=469 RepID=A0A7H2QJS8_9GAMM|nr:MULTISPECIES: site-specific DNA-methyltransferase [Acinetobacter]MDO7360406.1 DNA methyltransferase [Acinetobacter geminorum]QNX04885.1 site-specific DNA-methyltransferase [Acinetobacter seifertii]QNX15361.1 site-specific DNA-methyltransferase [Acinetobacter seifertii]